MARPITASTVEKKLLSLRDPERAVFLQRYFKTGKGDYAEGDIFLGLKLPDTRALIREYRDLTLSETTTLLRSRFHEARLLALLILVHQYKKGDENLKKAIYRIYLKNTRYINNWDLVDLSAEKIVGAYLSERNRDVLKKLARSGLLWERRIAMIACGHFISKRDYETPFEIAKLLLTDKHDLIHKAVGWMLREIGKRDLDAEKKFLDAHYTKMPRTMLRYAIEKFNPKLRTEYMKGLR